jgi:hypothetical protein
MKEVSLSQYVYLLLVVKNVHHADKEAFCYLDDRGLYFVPVKVAPLLAFSTVQVQTVRGVLRAEPHSGTCTHTVQ